MEEKVLLEIINKKRESISTLLNSVPVPIYYKEKDGSFVEFNKAFEKLLGMSREELLGKTLFDLCPKEYAETYSNQDKYLLANPGVQIYEHDVKMNNGVTFKARFKKSTFLNEKKEAIGIIGIIHVCK